jgi:hypothetical protein
MLLNATLEIIKQTLLLYKRLLSQMQQLQELRIHHGTAAVDLGGGTLRLLHSNKLTMGL